MSGWIKLNRKLLQWEWYTSPKHTRVFTHLLLIANHKAGSWRGIPFDKGQALTSIPKIAQETGLSVQNVRTVLKDLVSTGEITRKPTRQLTHITIVNWATYQLSEDPANVPSNMQLTDGQRTSNFKQEVKKEKKDKNKYTDAFESFWSAYPKKTGKGQAFKAWKSAVDRAPPVDIMAGLKTSPQLDREQRYIPNASTWLNGDGWKDEPADAEYVNIFDDCDWLKHD